MDRVFLDANVLFSAAYRPDAGLRRLWELEGVRLLTSGYAAEEARRNLPGREQRDRLDALFAAVETVVEPGDGALPAGVELPDKDRPILRAALGVGATHLLTGDVTHFGGLFGRTVDGIRILPPAAYLRAATE